MYKYFLSLIVCVFLSVTALQAADSSTLQSYSKQYSRVIQIIHQLPEARRLIAKVQQDGPVHIAPATGMETHQFEACWEANSRTIFLNTKRGQSEGVTINSILFELHNALATSRLEMLTNQAANGQIDKEMYVEQIERTEHNNALRTSQLLEKGIAMGIFPESARWPVPQHFEDHYHLQQIHGHSQLIAMQYDEMSPHGKGQQNYHGTIPGLDHLSAQDKEDLLFYMTIKQDLESSSASLQQRAWNALQQEWNRIQGCRKGTYRGDCSRTQQREQLLHFALKGNVRFSRLTQT